MNSGNSDLNTKRGRKMNSGNSNLKNKRDKESDDKEDDERASKKSSRMREIEVMRRRWR